jgi:hypothetical protein
MQGKSKRCNIMQWKFIYNIAKKGSEILGLLTVTQRKICSNFYFGKKLSWRWTAADITRVPWIRFQTAWLSQLCISFMCLHSRLSSAKSSAAGHLKFGLRDHRPWLQETRIRANKISLEYNPIRPTKWAVCVLGYIARIRTTVFVLLSWTVALSYIFQEI